MENHILALDFLILKRLASWNHKKDRHIFATPT